MPPVYFPLAQPIVPATAKRFTDDIKTTAGTTFFNRWGISTAGGGTVVATGDSNSTQFGRATLTASAAGATAEMHAGQITFPRTGFMLFQCDIKLAALSDGANRYIVSAGLFPPDDTGSGALFSYSDNINSGFWTVNLNGSVELATVSAANTTRNALRMYATGTGAFVDSTIICLINDVVVGAIPTVGGISNCSVGIRIEKTVGAVARTVVVDYAGAYWTRPDLD